DAHTAAGGAVEAEVPGPPPPAVAQGLMLFVVLPDRFVPRGVGGSPGGALNPVLPATSDAVNKSAPHRRPPPHGDGNPRGLPRQAANEGGARKNHEGAGVPALRKARNRLTRGAQRLYADAPQPRRDRGRIRHFRTPVSH